MARVLSGIVSSVSEESIRFGKYAVSGNALTKHVKVGDQIVMTIDAFDPPKTEVQKPKRVIDNRGRPSVPGPPNPKEIKK